MAHECPTLRRRPRSAFTLVELLVVIGIIAVLAAMLMAALDAVAGGARKTRCRSNLVQIYQGMRLYAPYFEDYLPDLYPRTNPAGVLERYRKSHFCRAGPFPSDGAIFPYGLWLLVAEGYTSHGKIYYCPNTPAEQMPGASENVKKKNIPEHVSYWYNYWPTSGVKPPPGLTSGKVSNCFSTNRPPLMFALMGDRFLRSDQLPHRELRGTNVCYWDGSVQFVKLDVESFPWNAVNGDGARVFSNDANGSTATRDAWVVLSKERE